MRTTYFQTLLGLLFFSGSLFSQGLQVSSNSFMNWKKMALLPDGGKAFIGDTRIAGAGFLQKINASGGLDWVSAPISNQTAVDVTAGQNGQVFVLIRQNGNAQNRLSAYQPNGQLSWNLPFLPTISGLNRLLPAPLNGGLAAGTALDQDNQLGVQLVRWDDNGTVLWSELLQEPGSDLLFAGGLALPDGDWIVGGTIRTGTETDYFLARIDQNGALAWLNQYPASGRQTAYEVQATREGGVALLGYSQEIMPTRIDLLKTNLNGNLEWWRSFFTEGGLSLPGSPDLAPLVTSFSQSPNGDFFLPYCKGVVGQGSLYLIRLNELGYMLGQEKVAPMDQVHQIKAVSSHQLALCGSVETPSNSLFIQCDLEGSVFTHRVTGSLYADSLADCLASAAEVALKSWLVEAKPTSGSSYFTTTDEQGAFSFSLPPGNYQIIPQSPVKALSFWQACDTPQINLPVGAPMTTPLGAIGLQSSYSCPVLEVDLQTGPLLPCTTGIWHLRLSNQGSRLASNTQLRIQKSPSLAYNSATFPLVFMDGDTLLFQIGDLPAGGVDSMALSMDISCDIPLGQAIRVEAELQPASTCIPQEPAWDGSIVALEASCNDTEGIQLKLSNKGVGDMGLAKEYIIIEDQIILSTGKFKLAAGADTLFKLENLSGAEYWMRAGQTDGQDAPSLFIENCQNPGLNDPLQIQLPEPEQRLSVSIHTGLTENGQLNPAELIGFPTGWQGLRSIAPDQELEYLIYFSNTNQDTVWSVEIQDSLSTSVLDISSFRPGASSHPYQWEIGRDGLLRIRLGPQPFPPDQSGFVAFRIRPIPELPPGIMVHNQAKIRFDYAAPMTTSITTHTISSPWDLLSTTQVWSTSLPIRVFPNPSNQWIWIEWEEWNPETGASIYMVDISGRVVAAATLTGRTTQVDIRFIPSGTYFIHLRNEQGGFTTLRWVKQ